MYAIVEDDYTSRRILTKVIRKFAEVDVIDFETAEAFLREIKINKYKLSAIFLDIQLPGMTGTEAIPLIRQVAEYKATPIIMCSASNDKTTIFKSLKAGACNFLVKPISKESIVSILNSLNDNNKTLPQS